MNPQDHPSIIESAIRRRSFLKGMIEAGVFTAAASSPLFAKPTKGGKTSGDKVRLACCGIGNQGGSDVNSLFNTGHCEIVALCDTDMGAPHT